MENYIENDYSKFWIENGILYFIYKKDLTIDINAAKRIVSDRLSCQNYEAFPVLADGRGIKFVSKEARDYLAKEGSSLVTACAILFESQVHKVIGNFYLTINTPSIPTKLFLQETDAVKWLEKYIK